MHDERLLYLPAIHFITACKSVNPHSTAHHQIVILGGGTAGSAVATELQKALKAPDVALIEPSSHHYDQPAWMQVGTGQLSKERTQRPKTTVIPEEVTWIRDAAADIDPDAQTVVITEDKRIHYDYLVVAVGVEVLWDRIRGLKEHLGTEGVCSVYGYEQAERTWEMLRAFQGGQAIFTAPSTPFKGGGTPLRLLHRADALWRELGVRENTELLFVTAASADFGGREYVELVERDAREKDVRVYFGYELIEVRPANKEAVFSVSEGDVQTRDVLSYNLLHVVPPMRPPAVIETSDLAYPRGPMRGYLDVDPDTLQHRRYSNVFGIGDAAGLPTVKTGEHAREQAAVLADRLQGIIDAEPT
jgi:sulfide:quinone oxidoreductase